MTNIFSRWFGKKDDDEPVRDVAALAAPLAAPAVHVVKTDAPSRSHFGGVPNLPAWGRLAGTQGSQARIPCASVALGDLPRAPDRLAASRRRAAVLLRHRTSNHGDSIRRTAEVRSCSACPICLIRCPSRTPERRDTSPRCRIGMPRSGGSTRMPSVERDAASALELSDKESDLYIDLAHAVFQGAAAASGRRLSFASARRRHGARVPVGQQWPLLR